MTGSRWTGRDAVIERTRAADKQFYAKNMSEGMAWALPVRL